MIDFIVYDQIGFITRTGSAPDLDQFLEDGESIMEGSVDKADNFYVKNGVLKPYPAKQSQGQTFDYIAEAWVDVRTDAEKARDMKEAIRGGTNAINAAAGRLRSAYLTSIPFQDMIYGDKRDEAIRYLATVPEPTDLHDFPFIESEVRITADTAYEVAQIYSNMAEVIRRIGADIERDRLGNIKFVEENATTPEEVWAVVNMIVRVFDEVAEEVINGGDGDADE